MAQAKLITSNGFLLKNPNGEIMGKAPDALPSASVVIPATGLDQFTGFLLHMDNDSNDVVRSELSLPQIFSQVTTAKFSSTTKKFGTHSLELEGTKSGIMTFAYPQSGQGEAFSQNQQFSYSFWFYPVSLGTGYFPLFHAGYFISNSHFDSYFTSGAPDGFLRLCMSVAPAWGSGILATRDVSINQWHHFALTRNASNRCEIFIDGISVYNTVDGRGGMLTTILIGHDNISHTHCGVGFIDEVAYFFKRCLWENPTNIQGQQVFELPTQPFSIG